MKKTLVAVSFILNGVFILLLLSLLILKRPAAVSFFDPGEAGYSTGACIVSVPAEGADLVFGPPEFSLRAGGRAYVQFSVLSGGRQLNLAFEAICDRSVVSAEASGYGLIVTALRPGETALQVFAASGVRDIAIIRVLE
jgi:hypothetical protein